MALIRRARHYAVLALCGLLFTCSSAVATEPERVVGGGSLAATTYCVCLVTNLGNVYSSAYTDLHGGTVQGPWRLVDNIFVRTGASAATEIIQAGAFNGSDLWVAAKNGDMFTISNYCDALDAERRSNCLPGEASGVSLTGVAASPSGRMYAVADNGDVFRSIGASGPWESVGDVFVDTPIAVSPSTFGQLKARFRDRAQNSGGNR